VGNAKAATDNKERRSLFMRLQKIENKLIVAFCVWVLRATRRFLRAVTSRQKRDQCLCTNYRACQRLLSGLQPNHTIHAPNSSPKLLARWRAASSAV
jgi:uncharacterized protein VirK/YbjX